jgi:hypothetical protein
MKMPCLLESYGRGILFDSDINVVFVCNLHYEILMQLVSIGYDPINQTYFTEEIT